MKAPEGSALGGTTGIVRRIDEWGIITPRAINPHKHWVFR